MKYMTLGAASVLTALSISSLALAGDSPPEAPPKARAPGAVPGNLQDPARIKRGKFIFHSTCADSCHGHTPTLFVGRRDLDPEYAFNTIRKGGQGATPMPPWGEIFSEEEIWDLVAYLKFLGKQ